MTSVTMAVASFLATSVSVVKQPARASLVVNAKASSLLSSQPQKASVQLKAREEERSSRRDLVFAATAAAAAACMVAKVAMADEETKPGTPEAKKKDAHICVTMPTARICHK